MDVETEVYQLIGSGGLDLKEHLGHTVDVTGTIPETAESSSATTATNPDTAPHRSLIVRQATHIFDDCLPQLRK